MTTDKVDVEVPSTAAGVITAVHGAEGDTIAVGAVLVEIDTSAAKPAPSGVDVPAGVAAKPAAQRARTREPVVVRRRGIVRAARRGTR